MALQESISPLFSGKLKKSYYPRGGGLRLQLGVAPLGGTLGKLYSFPYASYQGIFQLRVPLKGTLL